MKTVDTMSLNELDNLENMEIFDDPNIVEQDIVQIKNKESCTSGISLIIRCDISEVEILLKKKEIEKALELLNLDQDVFCDICGWGDYIEHKIGNYNFCNRHSLGEINRWVKTKTANRKSTSFDG